MASRQRFLMVLTCSWVSWPEMIPNDYEITSTSKFWNQNVQFSFLRGRVHVSVNFKARLRNVFRWSRGWTCVAENNREDRIQKNDLSHHLSGEQILPETVMLSFYFSKFTFSEHSRFIFIFKSWKYEYLIPSSFITHKNFESLSFQFLINDGHQNPSEYSHYLESYWKLHENQLTGKVSFPGISITM